MKHVVDLLLGPLRSSWKSCLIFEQIYVQLLQLSPTHKSFGFKPKFKFKGVTQNLTTAVVIEGDNITKIPDDDRDGMETTDRIPDQKAYRPTARKHSLYSVGNASSALVTYDL